MSEVVHAEKARRRSMNIADRQLITQVQGELVGWDEMAVPCQGNGVLQRQGRHGDPDALQYARTARPAPLV